MSGKSSVSGDFLRFELYLFARRIGRLQMIHKIIPAWLRTEVHNQLLAGRFDQLPDRRYMEEVILPTLAELKPRRLLDVGVEHYTAHYGDWLGPETERWTLDHNASVEAYGSPGRHITDDLFSVAHHFAPASFDVILLNGVFGYGVNRLSEEERSLAMLAKLLRPEAWLLIGWDRRADGTLVVMADDLPPDDQIRDPLELDSIHKDFRHEGPGCLPARVDIADSAHVYDWFRRV